MTFRELNEGDVFICNGIAMIKIKPMIINKQYLNSKGPDGTLYYIEDNGINIIESIDN